MLLTQPAYTRAYIAHQLISRRPRIEVVVPVYVLRKPRMNAADRAVRARIRHRMVHALKKKHGIAYRAALKWITTTAIPRQFGTLHLPKRERQAPRAALLCA